MIRRFTRFPLFLIIMATLLAAIAAPAPVQTTASSAAIPPTPAGLQLEWALEQVNSGGQRLTERRVTSHFTPEFLAWLPANQVIDVFSLYVAPSGPMSVARFEGGVTEYRANALLSTSSGPWRVRLSVEAAEPHRIDELFFEPAWIPGPAGTRARSWSSLKNQFSKLAPQTSFIAAEIDEGTCLPLARVDAETPLAIASSFKLYVLGALARQVQDGAAAWDELMPVRQDLISLPNGAMRDEPPGSLFPLTYYVDQMISHSDNTATDHLIDRVGREVIEQTFAEMGHKHPELNVPLLMTREWFAIRMRFSDRDIRRYELATEATRRTMIANMAAPAAATLADWEPWPAFRALETIEWFASAADLCQALADLQQTGSEPGMDSVLNALSIEPGITFDPAIWSYVGYKGGYETGVKSDVWLLQRSDGRWFAMAGVINDPDWEIDGWGMANMMIAAAELLAKTE